MSNVYYLVCMDCKSGFHLGKSINVRYREGLSSTYGFSDLSAGGNEYWRGAQNVFAGLQHFLMLHRGHELRVLPDSVDQYASDVGVPHSFPTEIDADLGFGEFLKVNVGQPNPREEAYQLPVHVIEKLKEF